MNKKPEELCEWAKEQYDDPDYDPEHDPCQSCLYPEKCSGDKEETPKLKNFDNKHPIFVDLTMTLAKHGFNFLGTNDLGELDGICQECGHPIRYEQVFEDVQTNEEFTLGSECMFKIYVFYHWHDQIEEKDIENADLQRAGKWLWIAHRDDYIERIDGDLPEPKNYDKDFKKLANDMKKVVMKVRKEIKKELEEEEMKKKQMDLDMRQRMAWRDFIAGLKIDIHRLNQWEMDFLASIHKYQRKGYTLTEKQVAVLEKIKNEKSLTNENTIPDKFKEKHKLFIGKKTKTWIINKLAGVWVSGEIVSVEKETLKALLCDIKIQNGTEKTLEQVWIPKSALQEEILL